MKKAVLLSLLSITMALPALADGDRHQSYLSYDDGGTIIRQSDDGREVEARRNMPIYPGDELVTNRRGRAEVRLSDGNIVGVDRTTAIRFRSILDSYEGDGNETVAELRYGKVALYRTDLGRDHVRLDTQNASYVAEYEAVYSVETDANGRDRVTVFDGDVEVRTPRRSTRLREGESANVDDRGVYDLIGDQRDSADDFERWFLRRAERFENYNNRYVDRRLGYWADDLDDYGRWVYIAGIGYSWRPYVAVGWRPYYNGYWHHRNGCLTWVSYDPWAWGTYHYGRWAYDPFNGWVWVPGYAYSPAWVYWWYGPSYIGWAPAGWWDCHRGYYDWAYRPYRNHDFGAGFYGRVRISEMDLRPWTFIDSNTIISNRVDRAALTTDAVKARLGRSQDGYALIGGGNARFTREELPDPAGVIKRRGLGNTDGRMLGGETGSGSIGRGGAIDMTPFFRRDGNVSGTIRDRIVRSRGGDGGSTTSQTPSRTVIGGGTPIPVTGGSGSTIGRGTGSNPGRGSVTIIGRGGSSGGSEGRVDRGGDNGSAGSSGSSGSSGRDGSWRGRVGERGGDRGGSVDRGGNSGSTERSGINRGNVDRPTTVTPPPTRSMPSDSGDRSRGTGDGWRSRVRSDDDPPRVEPRSGRSSSGGSSAVPRRVIDGIGGARIYPRNSDGSGSSTRSSGGSGSRDRGSIRGGDSGGSRRNDGGGSSTRSSGGGSNSGSSGSSSSGRSSSGNNSSGSHRESGGRIKRN